MAGTLKEKKVFPLNANLNNLGAKVDQKIT